MKFSYLALILAGITLFVLNSILAGLMLLNFIAVLLVIVPAVTLMARRFAPGFRN